MDRRILLAVVVGLVLAAFGGFYIALSPRFDEAVTPSPPLMAVVPTLPAPGSSPAAVAPAGPEQGPAAVVSPAPAAPMPAAPTTAPAAAQPVQATPASIEAEIASSDYSELQALLKANFADEYDALITFAVQRRNEGASDQQFGQEMFERIQDMLRAKLKFGTGASLATIDKLAGNEKSLFHALGTEGSRFCLKMLGKDDSPADAEPPPESIRHLMGLGTLYRFQAIVEGRPNPKPAEALTGEEMKGFETALNREGLNYKDVSSGAYMNQSDGDPGKPCLTLEKLHRAIATLPDGTRRKIYAGMFFLGRDK